MSSTTITPNQANGNGQNQGQPQGQGQTNGSDVMQEWRDFATQGTNLAKKYPEAVEGMTQILKTIQQIMVKVAANPQRTPPNQPPPVG